jgi:hypothetical protein
LYRHAFCSIRAAHGNRAYYSSNSTAADKWWPRENCDEFIWEI